MAQKKKGTLTDKQWAEIQKRYAAGEGSRGLGKEFGICESTIRARFHTQTAQIKIVAKQVLDAEKAFSELPPVAQITAQSLINDLRAISMHLAGAAKYGSITAHRLSGIANQQLEMIDETELCDPDSQSVQVIKTVSALTDVANRAAQTGINLLNANKELVNQQQQDGSLEDMLKLVKLSKKKTDKLTHDKR